MKIFSFFAEELLRSYSEIGICTDKKLLLVCNLFNFILCYLHREKFKLFFSGKLSIERTTSNFEIIIRFYEVFIP